MEAVSLNLRTRGEWTGEGAGEGAEVAAVANDDEVDTPKHEDEQSDNDAVR